MEVLESLNATYPHGYDDYTFEFEIPGRQIICKAVRVTVQGVNYLIKLESRPKRTDLLLDEDW